MAQLNPVSPLSGRPLPRRTVTSGQTCAINTQNQVDPTAGALTVKLPTSYTDDTVVMVENNSSTTNPITVDGNGQTIDGDATFSFAFSRAVVSFGRDSVTGQWRKLVTQRLLDGATQLFTLQNDQNALAPPVAAPGWTTTYELDFSAQPNQTINADGNYVIDGKTWAKSNSANDRVAMAIVNGTGLVIQPAISALAGLTRTAPMIRLPLSNLTFPSAFSKSSGMRVGIYMSAYAAPGGAFNGNKFWFGLDSGSPLWGLYMSANFAASNTLCTCGLGGNINNANAETTDGGGANAVNFATTKAWVFEQQSMIGFGNYPFMTSYTGADAAAAWPAETAMTANQGANPFTNVNTDTRRFPVNHLTGLAVMLAGGSAATANLVSFTIAKIRIQHRL